MAVRNAMPMINNPFEVFRRVRVINLLRRPDRWERARWELESVGLLDRTLLFEAIDNPRCGYRGSFESHVALQEIIGKAAYSPVLVCEDDVAFYHDAVDTLRCAWSELRRLESADALPWQMLYLNYNPESDPVLEDASEHLYRVSFVKDTACFAVTRDAAVLIAEAGKRYLQTLPDPDAKPIPFDRWLAQTFHRHMAVYAVKPMVAYQCRSRSDNVPGDQAIKDWRRFGC